MPCASEVHMSTSETSHKAALRIQSHYRAFRTRRELAGLTLAKPDWQALLNKVDLLLKTSQHADAQPKNLSVRGKWVRGLNSASAIGRVCCFRAHMSCLLHRRVVNQ